ncbi:MAG: VanZ family protein [Candidatus Cloacimonetes bacterium]|nr:VanZ family protein [Candidatus Cloacimonadota bacterium]
MSKKKIQNYNYQLTNLILYALLLIATPFLLLQNYLQDAIGNLSASKINIFDLEIPVVLIIAGIFLIFLIFKNYKSITLYRTISIIILFVMMAIGQSSTDFYFNHKFYELQHNWHYLAYGIYSFMIYRFFSVKKKPPEKIILSVFLISLLTSTFDEFIQVHISTRIFDICDIGKDLWGSMIGLIFIFFIIEEGKIVRTGWRIRKRKIGEYFRSPISMLIFEIIFSYLLIAVSSLLTEFEHIAIALMITLGIFLVIFVVVHLSQKKMFKIIFISLLGIIIIGQLFFFFKYNKEIIVHNSYGLTIYKGIPLVFFDVMIFENGTYRFVDKKHDFNSRDIRTISSYSTDILLIGSGSDGKGGKGFPEDHITQFIFNCAKIKPLQVIILPTPAACKKFNRLKKEGLNVVFIIHNTC